MTNRRALESMRIDGKSMFNYERLEAPGYDIV